MEIPSSLRHWLPPQGLYHLKRVVLVTALLLSCPQVRAQSDSTRAGSSMGSGFGATHYRFIDEAFSHQRVKYRGTSFTLDLPYQRTTDNDFFNTGIQASSGSASTADKKFEAHLIHLQLAASYARRAVNYHFSGLTNSLYLGGQIRSSNYALEDVDVLEEASVTFNHTLNFFVYQRTSISPRDQIELTAAFPVVGIIKRSRLDGGANQDLRKAYEGSITKFLFRGSKLSAINPLSPPQANIAYIHRITPKTDFMVKYQFNYVQNNQ